MQINELFKKLVESELLSESTRVELQSQFEKHLNEAITEAQKKATDEVTVKLTEQFLKDKQELVEAIDTKVEQLLIQELAQLKDRLDEFRDLEVEYKKKLLEAKEEMAATVKKDMEALVDSLDSFIEDQMIVEMAELKESIEEVKKINFGKKIFEAYENEFSTNYKNVDTASQNLAKANQEIQNTKKVLESKEQELNKLKHKVELDRVLESLQGRPRELMSALLENVVTDQLEKKYSDYIGKVLHESVKADVSPQQKETESTDSKVLAEGKNNSEKATKVVTGDKTPVLESVVENNSDPEKEKLLSEIKSWKTTARIK